MCIFLPSYVYSYTYNYCLDYTKNTYNILLAQEKFSKNGNT